MKTAHAQGFRTQIVRSEVTILFSSEAVQCSLSADGTIVDGDPKRIVQVRHTWTFSRQFSNRNQPWQVVSTA